MDHIRKIALIIMVAITFLSLNLKAQIAFDAKSLATTNSIASTTLSWNHTIGTGSNTILIVGVVIDAAATVSSIKFNTTQNLTLIDGITNGALRTELWQLVAPTSGSHAIAVTISSSHQIVGEAHSFSGVDQTTPIFSGFTNKASGTTSSACCANTTITNSVTSSNLEYVVDVIGLAGLTTSLTSSQNAANSNHSNNGSDGNGGGSYLASAASSVNMTWTAAWNGTAENWGWVGASLSPVGGLPIELLDFTVTCSDKNAVDLNWITATETNNDYFTIERSSDAIHFEKTSVIDGAGNSISNLYYSTTDDNPLKGISYYRLKQTDYDGKYTYSKIVPLESCDTDDGNFSIYPNPSNGSTIHLIITDSKDEKLLIEITDGMGKKIHSEVIGIQNDRESIYILDQSNKLNPGIYLITATFSRTIYNAKLIVE